MAAWGHIALPSCWVLERKHKNTKRFANAMTAGAAKSTEWDKYVLRDVTEQHLWYLSEPGAFASDGLVGPHKVGKQLAKALAAEFGCEGPFETAMQARPHMREKLHTAIL